MGFCTEIGVLFFLLSGLGLSKQSSCFKQKYGNCDPGVLCKKWDNIGPHYSGVNKDWCFNCGNGGYITWDQVGDGIEDCTSGSGHNVSLTGVWIVDMMVSVALEFAWGKRMGKRENVGINSVTTVFNLGIVQKMLSVAQEFA